MGALSLNGSLSGSYSSLADVRRLQPPRASGYSLRPVSQQWSGGQGSIASSTASVDRLESAYVRPRPPSTLPPLSKAAPAPGTFSWVASLAHHKPVVAHVYQGRASSQREATSPRQTAPAQRSISPASYRSISPRHAWSAETKERRTPGPLPRVHASPMSSQSASPPGSPLMMEHRRTPQSPLARQPPAQLYSTSHV